MTSDENEREEHTGRFLGLPYDWRAPSKKDHFAWWNPDDDHVFVPKGYGWGYTANFHEIGRRLHLVD